MLYRYYIGSNNETNKLEMQKAISITSAIFDGLTATRGTGYWQGKPEKMVIIEVETSDARKVKTLAHRLAVELKQQAIGLARIGKMQFAS